MKGIPTIADEQIPPDTVYFVPRAAPLPGETCAQYERRRASMSIKLVNVGPQEPNPGKFR